MLITDYKKKISPINKSGKMKKKQNIAEIIYLSIFSLLSLLR